VIETWSEGVADENMAEDILVEHAAAVHRHPWWQARTELTLGLLDGLGVRPPARVLDAGCGWGATLEGLERAGYRPAGMDISRRVLERLDRPGRELFLADLARDLPRGVEEFDAVLALDVIEHIDDDRGAVARLARLVRAGGVLVVSVPALPDLFSEFDEIQGHRRRYLPETLTLALADSRLEVERVFWWGRWLVPLLRRQRRHQKKRRPGETVSETYRRYLALPPWPAPWLMRLGFAFERRRALKGRLPVGTSLFAVARRPP
jgi:2-polyprenyl-3-methyl-5-hydroxy-6-metoxy-1,4-benzoquinol methylase